VPDNKLYTVRAGDTLSVIARTTGVKLTDLLTLNPQISNANLIRVGQQIVLPASVDRSEMLRRIATDTYPGNDPEWLKVAAREEAAGVRESNPSNPRIVEYLSTCTDLSRTDRNDDGTAWCSAFVNWCLRVTNIGGTNSATALKWKDWGNEDVQPDRGSIVVWRRKKGQGTNLRTVGGHVAFLLEDRGEYLYVLGGNQGDAVSRRSYPRNGYLADTVAGGVRVRNKYELVGFRRP
jgi:uncharacterized protein (TIGR02594 family)